MTGTKVIALSIGSERLNTRLGKSFCKWALSMAHCRSFRDRYSRDTMEALGLKGDNPVFRIRASPCSTYSVSIEHKKPTHNAKNQVRA